MAVSEKWEPQLFEFAHQLPKIELHAHLNGCIRESTLKELANQKEVSVPENLLDTASSTLSSRHYKSRTLTECFEIFDIIHKCVRTPQDVRRITREALQDFNEQNVTYLELRTTPRQLEDDNCCGKMISKHIYIATIIEEFEAFTAGSKAKHDGTLNNVDGGIDRSLTPRLLLSIDRSNTLDEAMENVYLAIDLVQKQKQNKSGMYVVGIDLGGNPMKNDIHTFLPALQMAKNAGLRVSIHCGEVSFESNSDRIEEIRAIVEFRPDRLGHALFIPPDVVSWLFSVEDSDDIIIKDGDESIVSNEKATCPSRKGRMPIECCPTSNVMTLQLNQNYSDGKESSIVSGLRQHPHLSKWLEIGYPMSISTDDPGVFCTNSSLEWYRLMKAMKLNRCEVAKILINSVDHIFEEDVVNKSIIRKRVKSKLREILENMHD